MERNDRSAQKKSGRLSIRVSRFPFRVIPLGFEPKTHSLEGCCSIQLSYGTIANRLKAISGCKINTNPPILQTLASYSDRAESGGPQPEASRSLRGSAGRRRASLLPPSVAFRLLPHSAASRPLPQPADFRRLPPPPLSAIRRIPSPPRQGMHPEPACLREFSPGGEHRRAGP